MNTPEVVLTATSSTPGMLEQPYPVAGAAGRLVAALVEIPVVVTATYGIVDAPSRCASRAAYPAVGILFFSLGGRIAEVRGALGSY